MSHTTSYQKPSPSPSNISICIRLQLRYNPVNLGYYKAATVSHAATTQFALRNMTSNRMRVRSGSRN